MHPMLPHPMIIILQSSIVPALSSIHWFFHQSTALNDNVLMSTDFMGLPPLLRALLA
jgi:hypothetical protein